MYEVSVLLEFSAAHLLRNYKGRCENLHGHNWKVEIRVSSKEPDKQGMVVDFKELKKRSAAVLDELDHTNLNDVEYFKKVNPTSENIAKYIYDRVKVQGLKIKAVTVWESDTSSATYTP